MIRIVAASLVAALYIAASGPQFAFAAETYKIEAWPQDLEKVPCSAFRKNPDGSWTQTAIIFVGGAPRKTHTYKGTVESQMLDARCK
jgi:hypothetical protein